MRNEPEYCGPARWGTTGVAFHMAKEPAFCASMAHELRQPLAAIIASASACRHWLAASPPNHERAAATLARILEDAESASETIGGLLALFTHRNAIHAPAQINDIIREACASVAHERKEKQVAITLRLDQELPVLALDRVQIRQLLINLIRNGIEAMDRSPGRHPLEVISHHSANGTRVEVCDWGEGVADPERIFDPHFSTKANGMGIGLALCRRIIEAHGGRLWMEPGRARGTRVIFTLPGLGVGPPVTLCRRPATDRSRDRGAPRRRLAAVCAAITASILHLAMFIRRKPGGTAAWLPGDAWSRTATGPIPSLRLQQLTHRRGKSRRVDRATSRCIARNGGHLARTSGAAGELLN